MKQTITITFGDCAENHKGMQTAGLQEGAGMPLDFQWHLQGQRIGERGSFQLGHGDLYIMSEKTVGSDWKQRNLPTLRHSAGAARFRP